MDVCERLRSLRLEKHLSQGDVAERTGLLRCYISRVEHGHTVPSVETLGRLASAFDMKLYQLLYDGDAPPAAQASEPQLEPRNLRLRGAAKNARYVTKIRRFLAKMSEQERDLLLATATKMVNTKKQRRLR